jgi:hypothetical protein
MSPMGQIYGGEECFLIYLHHVTKGKPFTEMARFVFGGDPCRLSEMNTLFINHNYTTFYNKISGYSMNQWIPHMLHTCRRLIYDALSSDAIKKVKFMDGQVLDRRWILHHLTLILFAFLVSLMILQCQQLVLVVRLLGDMTTRVIYRGHFILGISVITG